MKPNPTPRPRPGGARRAGRPPWARAAVLLGCLLMFAALAPSASALKILPKHSILVPDEPPGSGGNTPGTPVGLTAVGILGGVQLSWFQGTGPATTFRIYRSTVGMAGAQVAEVPAAQTYWFDADCALLETCVYQVSAYHEWCTWHSCGAKESARSHEAVAVGPPRHLLDTDGDAYPDDWESTGHSDPLDPASTPDTDDNCNGVPNRDESDFATAQGWFPVLDIDASQTFDPLAWSGELRVPTVRVIMGGCP